MKHLVVGAGATFGEALALGNKPEECPPLMRDFARKTWDNFNPWPVLGKFLTSIGCTKFEGDELDCFFEMEAQGRTNIEQFMEFAWQFRELKLRLNPGDPSSREISFWDNFMYHGMGGALSYYVLRCFYAEGGWRDLALSKSVASRLDPGDLVLNLNYDTVFEIALKQLNRSFCYSPNAVGNRDILVCKPHGSLNMVFGNGGFAFGQPGWLGSPTPPGWQSYSGLIPPRLNKHYSQHPMAESILRPAQGRRPNTVTMWGVGLTESDTDLLSLYRSWAEHVRSFDIINPDQTVTERVKDLLATDVRHFASVADWLNEA